MKKTGRFQFPVLPLAFLSCAALVLVWVGCAEDIIEDGPQIDVPLDPVIQGADGARMYLIEKGEFVMGDDDAPTLADNRPAHTVSISDFYMDEAEVTNSQYAAFLEGTRRTAPRFWNDARYNAPQQPVVGVTWSDADAYARWAKKRLPTEAEWEKAARGGLVGARYPWGSDAPNASRAIFNKETPSPVKSTSANGFGLYDMAGNVWEWCGDFYEETYYNISPKKDPSGPLFGTLRVVRGGSCRSDAATLEVAQRSSLAPGESNALTGFRCAKSPF